MVVEVEISPFQNHEIYVLVNEKWDGAFAVELWSRWQLFLGLIALEWRWFDMLFLFCDNNKRIYRLTDVPSRL